MPLTATPFRRDHTYWELLPANPQLARYIRCFWGSAYPYVKQKNDDTKTVVIPDTCVDIIYHIDYTENTITGKFCGINDTSFVNCEDTPPGHLISVFAIRFYAWSAHAFSEDSLKGTMNEYCDAQSRFHWLDQVLKPQLWETHSLEERSHLTEELFFRYSDQEQQNSVTDQAVNLLLSRQGTLSVTELAKECFISERHLERLFHEYIGITPKKLCSLVRYQCLWNDILRNPGFQILDAIHKYGYTDQAHLTREFRRYHTMDIQTAKKHAHDYVGNIQYNRDNFL